MLRQLPTLAVFVVLCACGGSPTSPTAIQPLLDSMTPDVKVNGASVQVGTSVTVAVGIKVDYLVNYKNNSGKTLHYGLLLVRDDGLETLSMCGATGSG